MKVVLALFLGLSLYALPAKADVISGVGGQVIFGNPYSVSGPLEYEAFATSVKFDRTTQSVVSVDTESFGSVGEFTFDGFNVGLTTLNTKLGVVNTLKYSFLWDNGIGDVVTLFDQDVLNDPHWYTGISLSGPDATGWQLTNTFLPTASGFLFPYDDPAPSPTPEPSSLILLGIGLVSAVFMSRKLITS
jgi:hypothetical protein